MPSPRASLPAVSILSSWRLRLRPALLLVALVGLALAYGPSVSAMPSADPAGVGQVAAVPASPQQQFDIQWSQDPQVAVPGETVTIRVEVQNMTGGNIAADVHFFVWTGGLTAIDAGGSWGGCTYDLPGRSVTCDNWVYEPEDRYEWWMVLEVPADFTDTGIEAYLQHSDGNTLDSNHVVSVVPEADLQIAKVSEPHDRVRAGETFTYTIFVDNLGPSVARNVTITDTLLSSSNVTIQSCAFSVSQGGGSITQFTCTTGNLVSTQFGTDVGTFRTNELDPLSPTSQGRLRASFRLTAKGDVDLSNTIRVSAETPDPDMSNNFATDTISVEAVADLAVAKVAAAPTTVNAGETACWTVTVTNNGPSNAENVTLVDLLPRAIVDGSITTGFTPGCSYGTPGDPSDPLTCNLGTMVNGDVWSATICGDVDPAFVLRQPDTASANYIDNDAWVTSATLDVANADNRATAYIGVTESADLSLSKMAIGTPVAGGVMHYELQVDNAGPSAAEDVTLRDFLPDEVEFLSASIDYENGLGMVPLACDVTMGSNGVFCPLGDIPPTGDMPIIVFLNVRIDPDATGDMLNVADVVLMDTPDPNTENNYASARVDLRYDADVSFRKTAVSSSVTPPGEDRAGTVVAVGGGTVTYEISVTNEGPSTIYNAQVTDWIVGLRYVYSTSAACQVIAGVVTCDLGTLRPGQTRTFELVVGVPEGWTGDTVDNESCVNYVLGSGSAFRRCDSESVPFEPLADLRIRKFGKPDGEVRAGELLTYTIIVDNLGPSFAPRVTITDELRADGGFDIMGLLPDATGQYALGAACTIDAPTSDAPVNPIVTNLPVGVPYVPGADPIAPGVVQRATITCELDASMAVFGPPGDGTGRWIVEIAVKADDGVDVNNCADVSSLATDPDFDDNSTCTMHEITDVADLVAVKVASGQVGGCGNITEVQDEVTAGNEIQYTIQVVNNGPSGAENVVIKDRLPPGITVTDARFIEGGGSCVTGTPGSWLDQLVCGVDDVLPYTAGAIVEVTAVVDPDVPEGAILENDVIVSSDQFDDNVHNNYRSNLTRVNAIADLFMEKSGPDRDGNGTTEHAVGTTETYILHLGNNGPSMAQNVWAFDVVPVGMRILRATVMGGQNDNGALENACVVQNAGSFQYPFSLDYQPGNVVSCDLGDLPPGVAGQRDIAVDVFIESDVPDSTPLTNTAYLSSGSPYGLPYTEDCNPTNNIDTWRTIALTTADLWLEKSSEPQKVFAGEQKKYIIRVGNDGPSDALDVVVTDTLPPEVTYEIDTDHCAVVGTDPVTGGQVLACPIGDLEPGEVVEFEIWVRVDECVPAGTEIVNVACVPWEPGINTTLGDPDPENNCDDAKNLVLQKADLKIVKFGKMDGQVRAGEILTYTVMVDNLGPSCATDVAVKDLLQSSEIFEVIDVTSDRPAISQAVPAHVGGNPQALAATQWPNTWPPAPPLGSVNAPTGIANVNQRLQWDVTLTEGDDPMTPENEGTLGVLTADGPPNTGRWILSMRVRAPQTQDIDNVADVVSGVAYDPDRGNNHAEVMHEITDVADLEVTKTALGEVQQAGSACPYGHVFDITTPGQAFPTAPYYAAGNAVTAGRRILYTVTVRNNGPSTAENVVLSDRLPAGVRMYPGSLTAPAGVNCETGTPGDPSDRLVCGLGTIHSGASKQITFQVVTDDGLKPGAVLENDVLTYSDIFDPANDDNHANTQTVVNTWADMAITKSAVGEVVSGYDAELRRFVYRDVPNEVTAGRTLRYEVQVQNHGPSDATNVQVLDVLPEIVAGSQHYAVTYLGAVGATCRPDHEHALWTVLWPSASATGQGLFCDLGTVEAGARKTFDIYVLVDESVPDGTVMDNGALVLFGPSSPPAAPPTLFPGSPAIPPTLPVTNDPCTNNNFVVQESTVGAVADVWLTKTDVPAEMRLDQSFEPDLAMAGTEHRYLVHFGNHGPSVARSVAIEDLLDYKQAGILGERFVRCEPVDPLDDVSCSFDGVDTVNVTFLHEGQGVVPGSLDPGDAFGFYLVTMVDPGYVLDADDLLAENCASITTTTQDFVMTNNGDCEQTLIVAEADLRIEKTDIFGDFLECDPVVPGGTVRYEMTVYNDGPSDAAEVYLVDWLSALGLIVDPDEVEITVDGGAQIVEVRDDGRITLRIGHDQNNERVAEWGRVNAGSQVTVRVEVKVAQTAVCGSFVSNSATVETRRNDTLWPPAPQPIPGVDGGPRTPTHDPDPSNNGAVETTTVECPEIMVHKTVSFNGVCPGRDLPSVWNQTAQPVTFCYEITNAGTTYLDSIYLEDYITSRTRPDPTLIYTDTITFGADPLLPVAPGEKVRRQVTLPHLLIDTLWDCGKVTDTVTVTANPVNSGRTDLTCVPDVTASDTALIEVPCAGVDWRLQLPVVASADCEGWIQVQNVGDADTKAMLVYWGDEGFCPPQAAGPLKSECTGLLGPGSSWSFRAGQLPPGARSAVVYSLSAERIEVQPGTFVPFADVVCNAAFYGIVGDWYDWLLFDTAYRQGGTWEELDFGQHQGEPLAATVNRSCPDPTDSNVTVNAAYSGISSDMEGARDPRYNGYTYYAPMIFASNNGLNSVLNIQNSGDECTSLEIWFKDQQNCMRSILADVLTVAPGETVQFDPNSVVGPDWIGSAWIRGSQPLGVVIDTFGANHFTSYAGVAGDVWDLEWSYGNQVSYLPLTYSEYQGWDTAIEVQNLSATYAAKVKVYFLDRSGDVITTLVDWICPRGSQTFFLPLVSNIGGSWVGSARVESQEWVTPGGPLVDPPRIHAVALMEKWADPQRTSRLEAVAYNGQSESLLYDWALGAGKGGTASGSAVMAVPLLAKAYEGITTELAITNLVAKPGFTDFAIFVYDQNGLIDYLCQKLNETQVEYIDLTTWGWINDRFQGSAVISAMFWEHDVWDASGQFQRNVVGLGGVAVERIGGTLGGADVPGDESKAFEMFPVYDHFATDEQPMCPGLW